MKIPDHYVTSLVQGIAGQKGVDLVFLIKDKQNVSEFKIAEKMGITVNEVRNILYRLQDKNIVSFTRKKDKKKGWYIYFWSFEWLKALDLLLKMKAEEQKELRAMVEGEKQQQFFVCPNKCMRIGAEQALDSQFRCLECDAILVEEDTEKRMIKARKELEMLAVQTEELVKMRPQPKLVEEPKKVKKGLKGGKGRMPQKKKKRKVPPEKAKMKRSLFRRRVRHSQRNVVKKRRR